MKQRPGMDDNTQLRCPACGHGLVEKHVDDLVVDVCVGYSRNACPANSLASFEKRMKRGADARCGAQVAISHAVLFLP